MKKLVFILLLAIIVGCKKEELPTQVIGPLPMTSFVSAYVSSTDSSYSVSIDLINKSGNTVSSDTIIYEPPYSQFNYSQQFGSNMDRVVLHINSLDSITIKHIVSNHKSMTKVGPGYNQLTFTVN